MTDDDSSTLVQPFVGANLAALTASLDRARAAQQRAQRRGQFRPDPKPENEPPAFRKRLAAAMPYPHARIAHLDSPLRADLNRWLRSLCEQPSLDDPPAGNLLFLGPAGAGKTVAACAVATHLADDRGFRVEYARVTDLVDDEKPDGTKQMRGRMRRADAVVLDDLGAASLTPFGETTLTDIVDQLVHPGGGGAPVVLILTSNATLDQLDERLPERLVSRLTTNAWAMVVDGDDRRGEQIPVLAGGTDPAMPCPYGCLEGGLLLVSAEHVDRVIGAPPREDEFDQADPGIEPGAESNYALALRWWKQRQAAAANSVRPCPHCRRPKGEPVPTGDDHG